jgi:ubiquinone/menaquinone biosynthesis C-methylase UbiE
MTLKESIKKNIVKTEYEDDNHFGNLFFLFDKYLYESNPKNMIDVGCANGDRTIRIAKYFNINLQDTFGVDYNEKNIAACKNLFNAEIIDLETGNLPYKNSSFDFVVCNQVLEHLKNYKKVVEELIRITCNQGYIAIGIPNLAHLINRLYLIFGIQPLCLTLNSSHVRGFTHKAFLEMLTIFDEVALVDCRGALMYPLPYNIAKALAAYLPGLSGYVCYLLKKIN